MWNSEEEKLKWTNTLSGTCLLRMQWRFAPSLEIWTVIWCPSPARRSSSSSTRRASSTRLCRGTATMETERCSGFPTETGIALHLKNTYFAFSVVNKFDKCLARYLYFKMHGSTSKWWVYLSIDTLQRFLWPDPNIWWRDKYLILF